jgi:bifunctional non-homologous end joining protein LigD
MSLREYRRKRDFRKTAEPSGSASRRKSGHSFVVQKHDATRLHYDFRLEVDGVLKSWAVPKGPSLDPTVKALAVQVEDHPLDYAGFEGIIPAGQYGGGTVMVWDRGEWEPLEDVHKGLKEGSLKFELHGTKLKGSWALVRMKDKGGNGGKPNWLLIKHNDKEAKPKTKYDITTAKPNSVLTKRSLEEIADDADRVWSSKTKQPRARSYSRKRVKAVSPQASKVSGAKKAKLPSEFMPQLATAVDDAPEGDDWLHEVKFDGYRLLCFVDGDSVRLMTRRGNDWTERFPDVADAVRQLQLADSLLDGELVAVDAHGKSQFQRLQNFLRDGRTEKLTYYVFDAPFFSGYDLRKTPLVERKAVLSEFLSQTLPDNTGIIRYSDHVEGNGPEVLKQCCEHGLEGIVAKRRDSLYESRRTRNWLKAKCQARQEFVIGGFTKPQGGRSHFGALLVGYREGDRWIYCGRVGTGFNDKTLSDLHRRFRQMTRATTPFDNAPKGAAARGVTWVEPRLVAEVRFSEWTDDGLLRHPAYLGLREDKAATDVVKEKPRHIEPPSPSASERKKRGQAMSPTVAGIAISNPDRVVYPEDGITKLQIAEYYAAAADWILPHIVDRPLTLLRCPGGSGGKCFVQRHWKESLPDDVDQAVISEESGEEPHVVIRDLRGLISLVQMNVLEFHPWGAKVDRIERPDRMVFDLDPGPGVKWEAMRECARELRDLLSRAELESFLRTSGGKGLHLVVPINRRSDWDEVGEFARQVALHFVERSPAKYVANMRKDLRKGRIYIDYVRNRRTATAIASFSTRARAGAPVATPLEWKELDAVESADQFHVGNIMQRLKMVKATVWRDFFTIKQSLTSKSWKAIGKPKA